MYSKGKIKQIVKVLREGGVIVYPTEGVYGLGCDPFNETAVKRLLKIKHRHESKGLILIAASWQQVTALIKIDHIKYPLIKKKTQPITWVFPATTKAPQWITGGFDSIAIRVTTHPIAKKICQQFGGPIVSTSANITKKPPIKKIQQIDKKIIGRVDYIVTEPVGKLGGPTTICEAKTGKILRT